LKIRDAIVSEQSRARSRRARIIDVLLVSFALACATVANAQDADQQITPNFQDTDIRTVTESVMAITGRNVILDPRINARVTLFSNTPVSPAGFYELYLAALQVHGYAATETGNVVRVIPDATARQVPSIDSDAADAFVTRTIRVENVGAAQLVPILRPLIAQIAHFAAHPESNMLVISDRAGNVDRIAEIIRRMDVGGQTDTEVIQLENAAAGDVVATLQALAQTAAAAQGAPVASFVADARTNSILLSGTAPARLRYRAVIVHLDTPVADGAQTEVRYLQYADAEELAGALATQFGGSAASEGSPGSPGSGGVTIWSHAATNALVINAPPKIRQDIMSIIDRIDIRRAQVLVEAIIVELSQTKAAELGVTWIAEGSGSNQPLGVTNFGTNGIVPLASAAAGGSGPSAATIAQGLTAGVGRIVDNGTSWAALLITLQGDSNSNIISMPRITAIDNEESEIKVGKEVPFITGQFTNTGAAAGSVNPFTTIQREEVGTSLRITPQINAGTGMILTIEQESSSLDLGTTNAADIVTNTRSISTQVYAEDGEILVLGGLTDDILRESEQRVPALGRIPGLGWMFKNRKTERNRAYLFVFIRPTILRDSIAAGTETSAKYNDIRDHQLEQTDEKIPLMRSETRPLLPELPGMPSIFDSTEGTEDGDQP
jgi:general secretion pathway protein D